MKVFSSYYLIALWTSIVLMIAGVFGLFSTKQPSTRMQESREAAVPIPMSVSGGSQARLLHGLRPAVVGSPVTSSEPLSVVLQHFHDKATDTGRPASAGSAVISYTRNTKKKATPPAIAPSASTPRKNAASSAPPFILYFTRTEMLPLDKKALATSTYTVTAADQRLLQKLVMAEAEGEPYEGKVAVANVVLNRLRSANFPDTIHDVIYDKHQFSPVANGRLDRMRPNEEIQKAVLDALNGHKAVSDDTYYFLSLKLATDLSVHHHKQKTRTIGNHTFYK
jgi:spore germination cell wall hydrolase CwlJ-like protein